MSSARSRAIRSGSRRSAPRARRSCQRSTRRPSLPARPRVRPLRYRQAVATPCGEGEEPSSWSEGKRPTSCVPRFVAPARRVTETLPQEYVWHQLKHVDLRDLTNHSLDPRSAVGQATSRHESASSTSRIAPKSGPPCGAGSFILRAKVNKACASPLAWVVSGRRPHRVRPVTVASHHELPLPRRSSSYSALDSSSACPRALTPAACTRCSTP
jgi:hypothetical protein